MHGAERRKERRIHFESGLRWNRSDYFLSLCLSFSLSLCLSVSLRSIDCTKLNAKKEILLLFPLLDAFCTAKKPYFDRLMD